MKLEFIKANGQGNDYIFLDYLNTPVPELNFQELAVKLSLRNHSIGSDGLVIISSDSNYNCFMRIFNADGSEASNCGTALRCVAAILHQKNGENSFLINTFSGVKKATIINSKTLDIEIDMGKAEIDENPYLVEQFKGYIVDVGNKHFIVELDSPNRQLLLDKGEFLEHYFLDIGRLNIEFMTIENRDTITIDIWERGSGATLACGTGATASAVLAIFKNKVNNYVTINMPGGQVTIKKEGNRYKLRGTVEIVYQGVIEI